MGFRNQFQKNGISDYTGSRLYGILYFFSNENMMQSCVYTLVRVTAELSATTPQVLGDVFGFFRGGVGNKEQGEGEEKSKGKCDHSSNPGDSKKYFCGWCASGLRYEVKGIQWIPKGDGKDGGKYRGSVGQALIDIKGDKDAVSASTQSNTTNLSTLTSPYLSPLTGELYTAVNIIKYYLYYRKHPATIDGPTLDNQYELEYSLWKYNICAVTYDVTANEIAAVQDTVPGTSGSHLRSTTDDLDRPDDHIQNSMGYYHKYKQFVAKHNKTFTIVFGVLFVISLAVAIWLYATKGGERIGDL